MGPILQEEPMATMCPKCHRTVEEDYICCADMRFTWKCRECHKRSQGFFVPFSRCHLCGGELEMVESERDFAPDRTRAVRSGVLMESNAYHYYRLAAASAQDPRTAAVFKDFMEKEREHLETLLLKYHVHEDASPNQAADEMIIGWLLKGIDFSEARGSVRALYDKAIQMERRTLDFYRDQAKVVSNPLEKELYLELAAEEEDHAALLETERDAFSPAE
jgi:rubrerythrin